MGKTLALHHGSYGGEEEERKFHNISKGEVELEATEEGLTLPSLDGSIWEDD